MGEKWPTLTLKKKPEKKEEVTEAPKERAQETLEPQKPTEPTRPRKLGPEEKQALYERLTSGDMVEIAPAFGMGVPLAIGSHKILKARLQPIHENTPEWPPLDKLVKQIFKLHTRQKSYLEAIIEPGSRRHDLDGNPVDTVSEEAKAQAKERLEKLVNQ